MKRSSILPTLLSLAVAVPVFAQNAHKSHPVSVVINGVEGHQDTPMEPDGKWHVHDPARPQPPVVTPGATFSENAAPPSDAIVLFDGTDLSHWRDAKGNPAPWVIKDGAMITTKTDIFTTNLLGDIQLHLEFREPTPAKGTGQGRGNSGIIFMGHYEIQVLDCYNNKTYPDGSTGAIYAQHPPQVNACRPPGEWETYDIMFTVPRFGPKGELITPAYATVMLNGVLVQNHQAIRGTTTHMAVGAYEDKTSTGPLRLQYHLNSVAYRNIWVRPIQVVNEP